MGRKPEKKFFSKKIYKCPVGTWKNVQHHWLSEMQIKTIMIYHLIPLKMAIIKCLQIANVGKDVEKRES